MSSPQASSTTSADQPTQQQPIGQKLTHLVQTLQFAWFTGHVVLIFCTIRYALSYIAFHYYSKWARFSYRTAFIAAAVTYGIVVYKSFRGRARAGKAQSSPLSIAADENVQYLAMALVWLLSPRQVPLAILPFAVYSTFHVATYTRTTVLPTLQSAQAGQKQSSGIADTIGNFVKKYYDSSMTLVAILEIVLWFRLLAPAIVLQKGSWIMLAAYTVFLRARFQQSTFVQQAVRHVSARGDAVANRQDMPPVVRQGWAAIKNGIAKAGEVTDIGRYVGGQAPSSTQPATPKKEL